MSSVIVNRLSLGLVGGGGPKKDANYLKEAKTTRVSNHTNKLSSIMH